MLCKYQRGTIWYMVDETDKTKYDEDSVTVGSRPVLIISNNSFNGGTNIVNYFPITSNLRRSPTHVPIKINGKPSNIQCEQWLSCGQHKLVEYIGTVSQDIMDSVERALLFQANMREYRKEPDVLTQLDSLKEYLDNYVNGLLEKYNAVGTVDSLLDNVLAQLDKATKALGDRRVDISKRVSSIQDNKEIDIPLDEEVKKVTTRKRRRWTEEEKKDILLNYKSGKKELMEKYEINRNQLYVLKARFSKELITQ